MVIYFCVEVIFCGYSHYAIIQFFFAAINEKSFAQVNKNRLLIAMRAVHYNFLDSKKM